MTTGQQSGTQESVPGYRRKEQLRLFVDGQIAAIANVNGLILVTRNIDDFKPFLRLKIENWHKA